MEIFRYQEYNMNLSILDSFLGNLDGIVKESSISDGIIKSTLNSLSRDIKFNIGLVLTFGSGIKVMIPIVEELIKNGNIKIDPSPENMILLSLAALSICYLEEIKNSAGDDIVKCSDCENGCDECENGFISSKVTKRDAQTILEELRMRGIGNGIVKKFVKVFKSISKFIKTIFKNSSYAITGLIEMFGYTTLLLPIMNAISFVIGKYDLTLDTVVGNLVSLGVGVSTFILKNGMDSLVKKIKDKSVKFNLGINTTNKIGNPINEQ